MTNTALWFALAAIVSTHSVACGTGNNANDAHAANATGGGNSQGGASSPMTGGAPTLGGASGSGGVGPLGMGGQGQGGAAFGGATATGGATSRGGSNATGGAGTGGAGTGGANASGGAGTGGANASGGTGTGGANASGGTGTGGALGAGIDRWIIDNTTSIHSYTPTLYGSPTVTSTPQGDALCFDGNDGLLLAKNPVEGFAAFTIEVLMRLDGVTQTALNQPRFLHIETNDGNRATMEARVTQTSYYIDTYLLYGASNRTLADSTKTHPVGNWVWVALTYANGQMAHYVGGVQDASGTVTLSPLGPGKMSLGVRQNLVNYFVGCIREVRVTNSALGASQLQK